MFFFPKASIGQCQLQTCQLLPNKMYLCKYFEFIDTVKIREFKHMCSIFIKINLRSDACDGTAVFQIKVMTASGDEN